MICAADKMIEYFGSDVKRINHALKVFGFASAIFCKEEMCEKDREIVGIAAILHDIGIKEAERKYNSSSGKYQEIEGPPIAKLILEDSGIDADALERVCYLIGNHHSYAKIDGLDFQILVEADFLVNIFEDNTEKSAVDAIRRKYFKTTCGTRILNAMYFD